MRKMMMLVAMMILTTMTFGQNAPITKIGVHEIAGPASLQIPITVTGIYDVRAISLSIKYDPAALTFTGMTSPAFDGLTVGNTPGMVRLGAFGSTYNMEYGTLCVLNFTATGKGSTLTFIDTGESCEYAGGPSIKPFNDKPYAQYYQSGEVLPVVTIGSQTWTKENRNVGTMVAVTMAQGNNGTIEKHCLNNTEANCTLYGGLYQWDEAMQYSGAVGSQGICPEGWRIPATTDFEALAEYTKVSSEENTTTYIVVNYYNQSGIKLKSSTGWTARGNDPGGNPLVAANTTGFTAVPSGSSNSGKFQNGGPTGWIAQYWSSSLVPGKEISPVYGNDATLYPVYWQLNKYNNALAPSGGYKTFGLSVRCIKN